MGKFADYPALLTAGLDPADSLLVDDVSTTTTKRITLGSLAEFCSRGIPLGGPSTSQPVLFRQADGTIVVWPLSTWSLTGDDGYWVQQAANMLPVLTGGTGQYDGTYKGPWTIGTISLMPADYHFDTGVIIPNGATANVIGHGPGTRIFPQSGVTAFTARGYGGGWTTNDPAIQNHGMFSNLRVDGSQAGATGKGFSVGGGHGIGMWQVAVVNFDGTSGVGIEVANKDSSDGQRASWSEKMPWWVTLMNNKTAINCVCDPNNNSMEYNDWHIYMQCGPGQSGLVVNDGVFMSGSQLYMQGNMQTDSVAPLVMQGGNGAGDFSGVGDCVVTIMMEHNGTTGLPMTIKFGSIDNKMKNCTGKLRFAFAANQWQPSNAVSGQFTYGGVITNDANLQDLATTTPPAGWA